MKTRIEQMKEFYNTLNVENLDIQYFADEEHTSFDDLREAIQEGGGFNVEIIYYSNAIKFLSENDASLKQSLEIASEFGYSVENLSSEILASLLAGQMCEEAFNELEDEINEFFEGLEDESEEDEDVEEF